MKTRRILKSCLVLGALCSVADIAQAAPLGTAITYHGQLNENGGPANGTFDLQFFVSTAAIGGNQVGTIVTNENVSISNGLFLATLDFGTNVFTGDARWLDIAVRPGTNTGAFITLSPRQPLTPTAYAHYAPASGTAGGVPWTGVTGVPAGLADGVDNDTAYLAGAGLSLNGVTFNVNFNGSGAANTAARSDHTHDAAALVSGTLADARLSANVALLNTNATFAGNVASFQDLISSRLRVGSSQTLRGNLATIAGGFFHTNESELSTIGGGFFNYIQTNSSSSFIGGGARNTIHTNAATGFIGGGSMNEIVASSLYAGIGAGRENTVDGSYGFIGGGYNNLAHGDRTTVAGGEANQATNVSSTVGGGNNNTAWGPASTIAGGQQNQALGSFAAIAGGFANAANGYASFIGSGYQNVTTNTYTTIGGGIQNLASANFATVGGGLSNSATGAGSIIAGGEHNVAGPLSAVGGGVYNIASGISATIPGGWSNAAVGQYSFAAGNRAKAMHSGAFVWADNTDADLTSTVTNQFLVRATGGARFETGGDGMSIDGERVVAGQAATAQIADNAVTTPKIQDGAVTSAKLFPFIDLGDNDTPGRLRLFHTSLGNPSIVLEGTNSTISVNGPDGVAQVELQPGITGGRLNLQDALGHETTLTLAGGLNSGGTFSLYSGTGGLRADMLGSIAGGRLNFYDALSTLNARLQGTASGGLLQLYNSAGAARLEASGEFGHIYTLGNLNLVNAFGGTVMAEILRSGPGGQMRVRDNNGLVAGAFGASVGGGGYSYLYNAEGNVTVLLDADNAGAGRVEISDTNGNPRVELNGRHSGDVATLSLYSGTGRTNAQITSGGFGGLITLFQSDGSRGVTVDGEGGIVDGGLITVYQGDGQTGVLLDGDSGGIGRIAVNSTNGAGLVVLRGQDGPGGEITVLPSSGSGEVRLHGNDGLVLFDSSGAERTRINRNGEIYLREEDNANGAGVFLDGGAADSGGRVEVRDGANVTKIYLIGDAGGVVDTGRIGINRSPSVNELEVNGNASKSSAGSWLANSDRRIKTDVRTITNALEILARVRPVAFRYTEDYRKAHPTLTDAEYFNVIAQEFAKVFPDAVTPSGDTLPNGEKILQVDTYPATIHAIAAINELHRLANEKSARITALEQANRSLESRLERLEQFLETSQTAANR